MKCRIVLKNDAEIIVEDLLERWDEEYAGEDNTEVTKEMLKAGEEFINKMKALYEVWQCEIVITKKINVREWIKENRKDWLEEFDKTRG